MLVAAVAAGLALAATLLLLPHAPWRVPLALVGGLWAPGYALACALWPRGRLSRLERHALAVGLGILLAPLAGLLASSVAGFRPSSVGVTLAALTCLAAALALLRRGGEDEPSSWSSPPSARATLALAGGAVALALLVALPPWVPAEPEPSSLALHGEAPRSVQRNATVELTLVATAGASPSEGPLVVTWDGEVLWRKDLALGAGASHEEPILLPTAKAGDHVLEARWDGRLVRLPVEVTRR